MAKKNETAECSGRRKKRSISYFLLSLLEDESYPHVQWTNKNKGEFKIHWMHASSGAWIMGDDAETFRLWAKAKGKLKDREKSYKTWKANFRCAMKSRGELEEIKLPESSYKKNNLRLWRFKNMELVNNYKADSDGFDWSRTRTQSSSIKPTRVLRRKRNTKIADPDETSEPEGNESSQPQPSFDRCEQQSSSAQAPPSDSRLQANYENQQLSWHEPIHMEDDDNLNPYGVGLLHILDQDVDTDSVVPNASFDNHSLNLLPAYQENQTESQSSHEYQQLPSIHSFITEQPFPGNTLLEQEWELFADEEKESKGKGVTKLFDIVGDYVGTDDDPFFYEGIYTELSRLGSYP